MTATEVKALRSALRADLATAMKERRREVVDALRGILAAIDNAEAVAAPEPPEASSGPYVAGAAGGVGSTEVARRALAIDEVRALIRTHLDDVATAAAEYERHGRSDEADRLRSQANVIAPYLSH